LTAGNYTYGRVWTAVNLYIFKRNIFNNNNNKLDRILLVVIEDAVLYD